MMKVKARLTYLPYLLNSMGLNAYGFFFFSFFALFNNAITFNVNNRAYQLQKRKYGRIGSDHYGLLPLGNLSLLFRN